MVNYSILELVIIYFYYQVDVCGKVKEYEFVLACTLIWKKGLYYRLDFNPK